MFQQLPCKFNYLKISICLIWFVSWPCRQKGIGALLHSLPFMIWPPVRITWTKICGIRCDNKWQIQLFARNWIFVNMMFMCQLTIVDTFISFCPFEFPLLSDYHLLEINTDSTKQCVISRTVHINLHWKIIFRLLKIFFVYLLRKSNKNILSIQDFFLYLIIFLSKQLCVWFLQINMIGFEIISEEVDIFGLSIFLAFNFKVF